MKNGGPAFPSKLPGGHTLGDAWTPNAGMSLRDYFAAHAPPIPDGYAIGLSNPTLASFRAAWNYEYADAMLAERERVKP